MRIARVVLQNVKSYADTTTIDLAPGINAVCGENGAGKSTILEAIGSALFGYRPYKLDAFLREGAKSGSITVTVEGDDGCSFDIVRKLGTSAGQAVYDETGHRIAEGEADVRNWRLNFFGLEPGTDLAKLFEDTIGPPQGTLTAIFLESPADKKDKFDRLLGIKDYPRAAEELREVSNLFRGQAEAASQRAALLEGSVQRLPLVEQRQAELILRKGQLGTDLDLLAQRQERLAGDRNRLERASQAVQRAQAELEMAQNRSQDAERRLEEQGSELRRAEEAARRVAASKPGAQAYEQAVEQLRQLEARRRERDRLRQEAESAGRNAFQWAQQVRTIEEKLSALAKDTERLGELQALVPEQERREKVVQQGEERVRVRQEALRQQPAVEERLAAARSRLDEARERLAEVEAARAGSGLLEALREQDRSLREELAGLEKQGWTLKQSEADLGKAKERLGLLAKELDSLRAQVDALRPLEVLAASAVARQEEWDAAYGEAKGLEARFQEAQRSRKQVEGGLCPFLHEPCRNLRPGVSLDAHFDGVLAESGVALEKAMASLPVLASQLEQSRSAEKSISRLSDLVQRAGKLGEERSRLEQEIEQLERTKQGLSSTPQEQVRVQELLRQLAPRLTRAEAARSVVAGEPGWSRQAGEANQAVDREQRTLAEIDELLQREAGAAEVLAAAQAALAELGDPRGQARVIGLRLSRERPEAERALEQAGKNRAAAQAVEERARQALEPYATLEEEMAAASMLRDQNEEAHRTLLAHQGEADRLPQRRLSHEKAAQEAQQAIHLREAAAQALEGARSAYDEGEHLRLRQETEETAQQIAQGRKELELCQEEIERLLRELGEMLKAKGEMEAAQGEAAQCRQYRDAVEAVRDVLKRAGPEIARELLRRVSSRATSLYRELLGQPAVSIEWGDDYEIRCRVLSEEREFKQLSGGEQMAAALAVRLALLQTISNVRMAFLDEPTAHMDALRRVNLASQIQNLRSFDQLLVISHDDSFDTLFGHVVRLAKRNGATVVEP